MFQTDHQQTKTEPSTQDELVARAAHELRGPLGSIANWVHLLSQSPHDVTLQQQGLAAIQRALSVSGRLIDELADVALLRSGRVRLRTGLLDLLPIVEMALDRPRAEAREKGIEVELVRGVDSMPVMGDPDRLQQVVLHLVGNAVKFTPQGGRVEVAIDRDGTSWRLCVSDTGPGLAPEVLERLWSGLRPADYVTPRAPASLGVGLAIVHHLAALHGGDAGVSRGLTRVPALCRPSQTAASQQITTLFHTIAAGGFHGRSHGAGGWWRRSGQAVRRSNHSALRTGNVCNANQNEGPEP